MIVDTSALVALIGDEAEASTFADMLSASPDSVSMSAASYLEAGIVVDGVRFKGQAHRLDELISQLDIAVAPVTESQVRIARQAYRDFGKGSGHPASLNFGDCFAYALATERGETLLFKGNDFSHTGIRRA